MKKNVKFKVDKWIKYDEKLWKNYGKIMEMLRIQRITNFKINLKVSNCNIIF